MNNNYIIGIVLLVLLIIGGLWYTFSAKTADTGIATTTTTVLNDNTDNAGNVTLPQATLPIAITNTLVSPSGATAVVNGSVKPNGAFTSYWYEYGVSTDLGSKTANQTMGSGFVSIQAPGYITNLTKNTTYYFKLVAENRYGRVSGNQYSFITTNGTPAPVGSSPTTKSVPASNVSRTSAKINGEVTPNKSATQYWFEYGKTTDLGNTTAFSSVGDGSAKAPVSASLSDLEPLTTYYFRINAQNQFGTINGSILNFKTTGPVAGTPPKVISQNATNVASTSMTLRGTINPNSVETKYWFEYSTATLTGSVLFSATPQISVGAGTDTVTVDADISNLTSKTTYYFRLVAQNNLGTIRGSELTVKTK